MSNAINSSVLSSASWRRIGLAALALCGLLSVPAFAQEEEKESNNIVMRAPDDAKFSISSSGTLSLTLPRAPTSGTEVNLKIINSSDYAIWSAPLSRSGDGWSTKIDRDAAQSLLVANAVKVEFPGAGKGGKNLQISFQRDQFQAQVGALSGFAGSDALFYEAPKAPASFDMPASLDDRAVASSFSMAARRYDEQLTAYYHRLIANHAGAHSLWLDLKTAGRLSDWPAATISAQENAYKAIAKMKSTVSGQISAHRKQAAALVKKWNSASGGDDPILVEFRDAS
jgi:hypothetical protein